MPLLRPAWSAPLLLQQAPASLGQGAFAFDLLRTLLALLAVCLLVFAALRFVSRRGLFGLTGAAGSGALRVVQRLPLEPRKTLYLVAAGQRRLLIATGESGAPRLIAELDAETDAPPVQPGAVRGAGDV